MGTTVGVVVGVTVGVGVLVGVLVGVDATKGLPRPFAQGLPDVGDAEHVGELAIAVHHLAMAVVHHGDDGHGV